MSYVHGRAFVACNRIWDRLSEPEAWISDLGYTMFNAGDIIQAGFESTVLEFNEDTGTVASGTEADDAITGGALKPANEMGFINAMGSIRNSDSGTGVGSLVVIARDGVSSFTVSAPRSQWDSIDISQVLFTGYGVGTISPFSVINVNDDLMYRGIDGVRSIRYTTSQIGASSGALSCTPLSNNISEFIAMDKEEDLKYASMSFAHNRIIITTAGRTDGVWGGIVSLDTAKTASLSETASTKYQTSKTAVYDGLWTGLNFLQVETGLYNGRETTYIISKNDDGTNELWCIDDTDESEGPLARLYTKKYSFASDSVGLFDSKEFYKIELWLKNITQDTNVTAYYRADGYELWSKCTDIDISVGEGSLPQNRYRLLLTPENLDEGTPYCDNMTTVGSSIQFCIQLTGRATVESCKIVADAKLSVPEITCQEEDGLVVIEEAGQYVLDDFTYEVSE